MIKIKNEEITADVLGSVKKFPKYTMQILNLANQNAQGTRPGVVGQLSELIQKCPERDYAGWKKWYLSNNPDAIKNATSRIRPMIENFKEAMSLVDEELTKAWVEDLVLAKTFIGLRFQESVLKRIASLKKTTYRLSTPEEESKGIDGFIGKAPVSIKPSTYNIKKALNEQIGVKIIFYEKKKDGVVIDESQL